MLIGFRFENFRSFFKEQAFSFSTSADRTHQQTNCVVTGIKSVPQLSKTSAVFGANASGKTNFVAALKTLRNLVLHSTSYTAQQFAEQYTPFQFRSAENEPTRFEIDVLIDNVRYLYGVSYDSHRILSERLLVYQTGKAQRWFERQYDASTDTNSWTSFSPAFHGPRELWRNATRPAALFLSTAAQLNSIPLLPLSRWFEHRLDFIGPAKSNDIARAALSLMENGYKSKILALLQSVDIKVDDVRIPVDSTKSPSLPRHNGSPERLELEFLHSREGEKPVWMRFDYEAAGTHRLFGLFGPLLAALDQNKLLVIDDFDLHLHPLVARQIIRIINDPKASRAQLLLVSHNVALMDLSMFRRDEIWLTEIDENSTSNLYPVSRENPRKHEQIAKGYLQGRYGAVPHIKQLPW